jgi:hypothetical protein
MHFFLLRFGCFRFGLVEVVSSAGLYLIGTPFLRRRKSTLIDGAGDDARDLSDHLVSCLHSSASRIRARAPPQWLKKLVQR